MGRNNYTFCKSCNLYKKTINDLNILVVQYVDVIEDLEGELDVLEECIQKVNSDGDGQDFEVKEEQSKKSKQKGERCQNPDCKAKIKKVNCVHSSKVKIQELKKEVEKLKQDISTMLSREKTTLLEANNKINILECENNGLKSKIKEFERKEESYMKIQRDLNADIKVLNKDKCESNLAIKELQLQKDSYLTRIKELECKICCLNFKSGNFKVAQTLSTIDENALTTNESNCKVNSMKAELKKYSEVIVDLVIEQEKNLHVKSENSSLKNKLKQLEKAKQSENMEIVQCTNDNLIRENCALKVEVNKCNEIITSLRRNLEQNTELLNQNKDLKIQIESCKNNLHNITEQQGLYEKLKQDNLCLKTQVQSLLDVIKKIEMEKKQLKENSLILSNDIEKCNKLIIDLVVKEEKCRILDNENSVLKNRIKELENDKSTKIKQENQSLKSIIDDCLCKTSLINEELNTTDLGKSAPKMEDSEEQRKCAANLNFNKKLKRQDFPKLNDGKICSANKSNMFKS
ncbi:unnamed protein product [Brassicogethes aeneus]|uniref:Uncharacterized protein n=1 Tax=Brassicogethes aeneus TaxID=1431903 RepID=A0A9P0FJM2_BRAAE|nr:unnamed protein product [Brassicogethes aeneus]